MKIALFAFATLMYIGALTIGAQYLLALAKRAPVPKVTMVERTERCTVYRVDRGESITHIANCK